MYIINKTEVPSPLEKLFVSLVDAYSRYNAQFKFAYPDEESIKEAKERFNELLERAKLS